MKGSLSQFLKCEVTDAEVVVYAMFGINTSLKYGGKIIESTSIEAASAGVELLQELKLNKGRFYNDSEANIGAPVVVLGYETARKLFEEEDPIGKEIRAFGRKVIVIGVLKKYGEMMGNVDNTAYVPANYVRSFTNTGPNGVPSGITIKPNKNMKSADFERIVIYKLRNYRGLKPDEIDNFFVNKISTFIHD